MKWARTTGLVFYPNRLCMLVTLVLATLGACQAPSSDPASKPSFGYNIFYDQSDHLRELLNTGDLRAAKSLYLGQASFFSEHEAKYASLLSAFGKQVNVEYTPRLQAAAAGLNQLANGASESSWKKTKETISSASSTLTDYDAFLIVQNRLYRAAVADDLKAKLEALTAEYRARASLALANFSDLTSVNFFDTYPVEISDNRAFQSALPAILGRLRNGSSTDVLLFARVYFKQAGGPDAQGAVCGTYYAAWLREQGKTLDPLKVMRAVDTLKSAGIHSNNRCGAAIAMVLIMPKPGGGADFDVLVDESSPIEVRRLSSDVVAKAIDDLEYAIVVKVNDARSARKLLDQSRHSSTYIAGYRSEHNAAFDLAQMRVLQAQSNLNGVRVQSAIENQQPQNSVAGAIFLGLAHGLNEGSAEKELRDAMADMQSTPSALQKEIYSNYEYVTTSVLDRRTLDIDVFFVRKGISKAQTFSSAIQEERTFSLAYQLHDKDPARNRILSSTQTEDALSKWEKEPLKLSISQLLTNVTGLKAAEVGIADLSFVPMPNKVARAAVEPIYDDGRRTRDQRFDSVVIVTNPNGSGGAGFFVRSDVVLTNRHVVEGADFAGITTFGGQQASGKVIASDVRLDLALLRVGLKGRPVTFPSAGYVELGTPVEAIGHPKGFTFSITKGIVSGLRMLPNDNGIGREVAYIQTDTPISPGSSGGPLFRGQDVVGINTWARVGEGAQNLNFAVDYREALRFIGDNK